MTEQDQKAMYKALWLFELSKTMMSMSECCNWINITLPTLKKRMNLPEDDPNHIVSIGTEKSARIPMAQFYEQLRDWFQKNEKVEHWIDVKEAELLLGKKIRR